ncbi:hypothetical protein HMPREF3034_00915 [Prevotella sp. DNF00663]|nr:hypothetical protein HMPREF3034_00915 [Prevotella sp. DNF00663]
MNSICCKGEAILLQSPDSVAEEPRQKDWGGTAKAPLQPSTAPPQPSPKGEGDGFKLTSRRV